jgi:excisionase family DNA binding protein
VANPPLHPEAEAPRLALTPRETAHSLGISERSLWSLTRQGRVPCVRLGGSVRYPLDALKRWLSEQTETKPATPKPTPEGGAL